MKLSIYCCKVVTFIIMIIIKYIYIVQNRIMQLMRWIDSRTAIRNAFSLCLNVSTETSWAWRSAGRLFHVCAIVVQRLTCHVCAGNGPRQAGEGGRGAWSRLHQSWSVVRPRLVTFQSDRHCLVREAEPWPWGRSASWPRLFSRLGLVLSLYLFTGLSV